MAYIKTTWKDRLVESPNTFEVQENPDGTITLIPTPGTVTQAGTPVNATNLNKIEDGIVTLENNVTTHLADMVTQRINITLAGFFTPGAAGTNYVNYNQVTKMCELNAFMIRSTEIVGGQWYDVGFTSPYKPSQQITFIGIREGGSDSPIVENIKCRVTTDGKLWVLLNATVSGATQYKIHTCYYAM